jgi:hypothetical protein
MVAVQRLLVKSQCINSGRLRPQTAPANLQHSSIGLKPGGTTIGMSLRSIDRLSPRMRAVYLQPLTFQPSVTLPSSGIRSRLWHMANCARLDTGCFEEMTGFDHVPCNGYRLCLT